MLEVRLLGRFEVQLDRRPVELPLRAAQSLLAYLMLNAGTPHRREQLAGLFWPDVEESKSKGNLRHILWRIRKALGGDDYLLADDIAITFNAQSEYWLDAGVIDQKVDSRWSADDLARAVSLYTGELLPGFYDEWVVLERQRLQAAFENKMTLLMDRLVEERRWEDALAWGERWIALGHTPEAAYRALMTAHGGRGDLSSAATVYRRCVAALRTELGVEPSSETRALHERLVLGTEPLARPRTAPRHNLPAQVSSFVGREREIAEVKRRLGTTRLLTLTGAGGSGKTRLALQAAGEVVETYAEGVWCVELAALADPALVPQVVSVALDLVEQPGRSHTEVLADYLRTREVLLVLDNCEHLLEACAQLAEALLRACPKLHILTTSREALNIAGETTWIVPTLGLPDQDTPVALSALSEYDAIRLFIERASAAQPAFALSETNASAVASVCHQLDGIPLAIELAAVRMKTLPVEQIAARLNDRFHLLTRGSRTALERHQTLRATMDWSYQLLTMPERILLQRLSVFSGGWTLDAAEQVCSSADVEAEGVLDLLSQLVSKSLVLMDAEERYDGRYRLLETIRQYAREKLLESGETERIRGRHLEFFLRLAEQAEPELRGPSDSLWLTRLDLEHDNLRAALEWSLTHNPQHGLRLAAGVWLFWQTRGSFDEGREWLSKLLALSDSSKRTKERALALHGVGTFARDLSDPSMARASLKESLDIWRELGADGKQGLADTLYSLACVAYDEADFGLARSLCEESIALYRELDDQWGIALVLGGRLAEVAVAQGDWDLARTLCEESLTIQRQLVGEPRTMLTLFTLATVARQQGDDELSEQLSEEAFAIARGTGNTGDKPLMALALNVMGEAARWHGDYEQAEKFYSESLIHYRELGSRSGIGLVLFNLGYVMIHHGDYTQATALFRESIEICRELGHKRDVPVRLLGLACIAGVQGRAEWAARLFGTADTLLEAIPARPDPADQVEYERYLAIIRAQLDEATFAAAWAEGRVMTLEQAIAYALKDDAGVSQD